MASGSVPLKKSEQSFKYCFVPKCTNSTISTPEKLFFHVPKDVKLRKLWFEAARRDDPVSKNTTLYACDDHFSVQEDVHNYLMHQLLGESGWKNRLKIKPGIVPHLFECQHKVSVTSVNARPSALKRKKLITDACDGYGKQAHNMPNISENGIQEIENHQEEMELDIIAQQSLDFDKDVARHLMKEDVHAGCKIGAFSVEVSCNLGGLPPLELLRLETVNDNPEDDVAVTDVMMEAAGPSKRIEDDAGSAQGEENADLSCQDDAVSTHQDVDSAHQEDEVDSAHQECDIDSTHQEDDADSAHQEDDDTDSWISVHSDDEEWNESDDASDISTDDAYDSSDSTWSKEEKGAGLEFTRLCIEKDMRFYLGIAKEAEFIVDHLADKLREHYSETKCLTARDVVYLILHKIRMNDSFKRLGHQYGISTSQASKLFSKFVPFISQHLSALIYWPTADKIREHLPVPFRFRYSDVVSIIDAFEIEIQKPTNAMLQSLTWSAYKHCNTIKYLISILPDGCVSYISKGVGGRTSDLLLTTISGYLSKLPPNKSVMADRGFKNLARVFADHKCKLVRPPSVETGKALPKSEVKQAKRIASLRIHVERAISRIREFQFLAPHSRVPHTLVPLLDNCVTIASSLVNLQGPLIK